MILRLFRSLIFIWFLVPYSRLLCAQPPGELSIAQHMDAKLVERQASYFRGWNHLVEKLRAHGVSEQQIKEIYQSKNMPEFGFIGFSMQAKESPRIYKEFYNPSKLKTARNFLKKYSAIFDLAEKEFNVSRNVVTAILLVETHFGSYTGNSLVINRLSRLAAIADPKNLEQNFKRHKSEIPDLTIEEVEKRGRYIEDLFFPEIPALMQIARDNKLNAFQIKGSPAGAFGIPQFLPTTYLKFAVDADGDGRISLFHEADAIWSTSNFLANSGWKDSGTRAEKEAVIWKYNRSQPYVDTILHISTQLGG